MFDSVLRGAQVVSNSTNGVSDIGIIGGTIAEILPAGSRASARRDIDLSGLTLIPGLVDAHVHFRGSPLDAGEQFSVGSAAALAGGVTTVLEMPVTDPMVLTGERLRERRDRLAGQALSDFALYGGAGPGNVEELPGLKAAGAVGFKSFLHEAPPGRQETLGAITATRNDQIWQVMQATSATGLVHAIHAEDNDLLRLNQSRLDPEEPAAFHLGSRPELLEDVSVASAATMGLELEARLHFVHVSSPLSVDLLGFLARRGADFSVETGPHYLRFTAEVLHRYGMHAKCNPPLRSPGTRKELVERVANGAINIIASDHCSYPIDSVQSTLSDPICAPAGFPGIQYMLPALLSLVDEGKLSLSTVVSACSLAPARRFSLAQKGDIAPGMDADFAVIDLARRTSFLQLPHQSSAIANVPFFHSETYAGRVVQTWLRGKRVFDGDGLTVEPGYGSWVAPELTT